MTTIGGGFVGTTAKAADYDSSFYVSLGYTKFCSATKNETSRVPRKLLLGTNKNLAVRCPFHRYPCRFHRKTNGWMLSRHPMGADRQLPCLIVIAA